MAIKMDGHTITSLQLKASDGSEVTKQLTEEGTIPTPTEALSIIANGTYDVTDKASAVVNVPAPEINLQNKTATANGEVTADEGYDGLGVVTVAVSGDTPTYQEKTATQNGVVLPDEGYDALSKVTVNVPTPETPTPTISVDASGLVTAIAGDKSATHQLSATDDADFLAENIKQGVNIFGVLGTLAGGGGSAIKITETTLTEEVNSYGILQAMNAHLYYKHSVAILYIFANTAAMGGADYTNNNYALYHNGTTKETANMTQHAGKIPPSDTAFRVVSNVLFEATNGFINADGTFSYRSASATVLAPVGARCLLVEIPFDNDLTLWGE